MRKRMLGAVSPFAILAMALALSGCATIDMECPKTGGETIAIGGSTVGNQIIALGATAAQGAMKTGGLMAAREQAAAAEPVMHVHYSYLPIFGADYVACQNTPQPSAPLPVNVVQTVKPPQ
jgi:hypothetical protein